jgi:hypothetical protein
MTNETYRTERTIKIFSIIMLLIIFVTGLRFFNVIDTRTTGSNYCVFPNNFECKNLVVTPLTIRFDLIYTGPDLHNLVIESTSAECSSFTLESLKPSNQAVSVSISCKMTAPKTKNFKETLIVRFTGGGNVGLTRQQAKIRSNVS